MAAGLASLVILLTAMLAEPQLPGCNSVLETEHGVGSWMWVLIFVAVSLVAAWMRRVSYDHHQLADPAYADAHRLLSELHVVARQLSLGPRPDHPRRGPRGRAA